MADTVRDNYSTAEPYMGTRASWLDTFSQRRVAAYDFYDDLCDNNPTAFKLLLRGDESNPIYVPTAKTIVKTLSRYVARDLGFAVSGDASATETADAITAFGDLFKRERFFSTFASGKRTGLRRGDQCIYVLANPLKPEGSRLSIRDMDPRTYFPIADETDPKRTTGADIIDLVILEGNKQAIRRQRYLRSTNPLHSTYPGPPPAVPSYDAPVEYLMEILEMENWQTQPKRIATIVPQAPLAAGIVNLPIYHIKYYEEGDLPFGRSCLQGLERLMLGINQGATDEDVALAMAGLGLFRSSATPVDDNGDPTDWVIGPKRVVETDDFERISGVPSVDPSQAHLKYLKDSAHEATGVNDVALGNVDTSVAESGIALALRMGPLIDEAEEIDLVVSDVLTHLFYDLKTWLSAYEGINLADTAIVEPSFGPKLPRDMQKEFDHLMQMYTDGVVSLEYVHNTLREEFGMEIPKNEVATIQAESEAAAAAADPFGTRLAQEAAGALAAGAGAQNGSAVDTSALV